MAVGKLDAQKTQAARQQMEFADTSFWKPKFGNGEFADNYIRILPPHEAMEGKLFQPVALHWMPDKTAYICPRRMVNSQCPICDAGFQMIKLQGKDVARKFWPSWAAYMNIVVINKDGTPADENVKLWSANRDVTDLLLDMVQDEDCGDFTDLDGGRNVQVRCKKVSEGGFDKYDYIIRYSPKQTPFNYPKIIEGLIDPTQVNQLVSTEDLQRLAQMLIAGPGAQQADPLALPQPQAKPAADEWGEVITPVPISGSDAATTEQPVDEWGSNGAEPEPTPAKKTRAKKDSAEDIEAQKERLREQLKA